MALVYWPTVGFALVLTEGVGFLEISDCLEEAGCLSEKAGRNNDDFLDGISGEPLMLLAPECRDIALRLSATSVVKGQLDSAFVLRSAGCIFCIPRSCGCEVTVGK